MANQKLFNDFMLSCCVSIIVSTMNHNGPLFKEHLAVNKLTCMEITMLVDNHEYVRKLCLCELSGVKQLYGRCFQPRQENH